MTRTRLRLVKVLVQPVFMLDDGEGLAPVTYGEEGSEAHPIVHVPASEWPSYYERFEAEIAAWEKRLNEKPPER